MNAPAAISGTFVRIDPVPTRKVVRLHIECPIEVADQVLAALGGYPDPANPVHVAVAQLRPEAVKEPESKPRRRLSELPLAQRAGMLCQEGGFRRFLEEEVTHEPIADPADAVRQFCEVLSRAELDKNARAGALFQELESRYHLWLRDVAA